MPWVILAVAGVFEALMALGLGASDGFTKLRGVLVAVTAGAVSFYLLSLAMRTLPAGTAYAVWTGIGAALAVLLGVVFRGEPAHPLRLLGVAVVLGGVVLLRLAEG